MAEASEAWSRRRLLVVLTVAAVTTGVLVVGLGYGLVAALRGQPATAGEPADAAATAAPSAAAVDRDDPGASRDAVAAEPMLATTPADGRPGRAASSAGGTVVVPPATGTDPLGVPTGFPRTREGALGQLAGIATTVLGQLSPEYAAQVYTDWAEPGGVGPLRWRLSEAVVTFVDTAGPQAMLAATPVGGQVKGSDGPDWLVGCVLLRLQVFTAQGVTPPQGQVAFGYCERLTWDPGQGRWVIAAGAAPAPAPHTWPGTEVAVQAGWRTWVAGTGR